MLFLHGWPTSSFLWRNVMPAVATTHRAIALDLPGFGKSDKPTDASYSFRFNERAITAFLDALHIQTIDLVVHDLGGPIGLYWASQNPERVRRLVLTNTLVYPELSWAVKAFVVATKLPGLKHLMSSRRGLIGTLEFLVADPTRIPDDAREGIAAPFTTAASRQAMLKAAGGLHPAGFSTIADWVRQLKIPVRIVYGAKDRALPDIERTIRRLRSDLPQAEITCFEDCGHFLQEERPKDLGTAIARFLNA